MKKIKIPCLYLLSFVLSISPVAIYFFINADRYVHTVPERIKLTTGLICLCVIVFLKVMGKLKMPSRTMLFGFVFLMCYLLESVLDDLLVFSFLALLGEIMDCLCQIIIRREREKKTAETVAKITAQEVERALNGRV